MLKSRDTRYHGDPCKYGHTERYVCNNHCCQCEQLALDKSIAVRRHLMKIYSANRRRRIDVTPLNVKFFINSWGNGVRKMWTALLSWLLPLVETEVQAVLPVATQAVNNLATSELNALANNDAKDTGHILASVVQTTTQQMAVAGVQAGAPAVLQAIAHAVATAPVSPTKAG